MTIVTGPTIAEIDIEMENLPFPVSGNDMTAYLEEYDRLLKKYGYHYTGARCTCPNDGEHGHHPACGFEKVPGK